MNHQQQLATAIERAFTVLEVESTPAELAPHVTRAQREVLADVERWAHDVLAAIPPIAQAATWASPTELRREVATRTGAGRDAVSRKSVTLHRGRRR